MDPIKNAGAVDYAMTVPQNQNQVEGYGDYSSMPMVYEPDNLLHSIFRLIQGFPNPL